MSLKQQEEIFRLREKIKNIENIPKGDVVHTTKEVVNFDNSSIVDSLTTKKKKISAILEFLAIIAEKEPVIVSGGSNYIENPQDKLKIKDGPQYIPDVDTKSMKIELKSSEKRVLNSDLSSSLEKLDKLGQK